MTGTDNSPWFALITTTFCVLMVLATVWIGSSLRKGKDQR